jgi:hypothetical protein
MELAREGNPLLAADKDANSCSGSWARMNATKRGYRCGLLPSEARRLFRVKGR